MSLSVARKPSTLMAALWPVDTRPEYCALRAVVLAVVGSLLLTASAKAHVPFWPVPMTMQTFAVVVIGMAYGWRLGGATVLLYLVEGAAGLPVFSGTPERGIGLAYMVGPTGGYLVGFLVAALLCGWLAERGWDRKLAPALLAMLLGHAVIFIFGVGYLSTLIGMEKAIDLGVTPFLLGTVVKTALAAAVLWAGWLGLERRRGA
ncbi:MAG TPA: biotin transporter BioY [Alphaproteobacteria bacterium]|jgi:biotin transport system substrate-specific component